jgi:hypothetical protein
MSGNPIKDESNATSRAAMWTARSDLTQHPHGLGPKSDSDGYPFVIARLATVRHDPDIYPTEREATARTLGPDQNDVSLPPEVICMDAAYLSASSVSLPRSRWDPAGRTLIPPGHRQERAARYRRPSHSPGEHSLRT